MNDELALGTIHFSRASTALFWGQPTDLTVSFMESVSALFTPGIGTFLQPALIASASLLFGGVLVDAVEQILITFTITKEVEIEATV